VHSPHTEATYTPCVDATRLQPMQQAQRLIDSGPVTAAGGDLGGSEARIPANYAIEQHSYPPAPLPLPTLHSEHNLPTPLTR
jgi:hypothetical protein